jgi:2-iminobutanoate/2-iminopropanoate deaminase
MFTQIYVSGKEWRIKMLEYISTEKAPKAVGPYSQAVQTDKTNKLVFTSGQIPINPLNGEIPKTLEKQTEQAIQNLKNVLEAAGSELERVIKTTVFIKNMNDFSVINEIYATFFKEPYPARSCVEVARLPKDVLLEIEAIAELN